LTQVTKQGFLIEEKCLTIGESRPRGHNTYVSCFFKGSLALAFLMCSLDVRINVKCVFCVIFKYSTLKMTSKMHSTRKRTFNLHFTVRLDAAYGDWATDLRECDSKVCFDESKVK
jgi:hypothetical protein